MKARISASNASDGFRADGTDRGSTLVEILVSVVLLGTVIVPILISVRTTVIASRLARDQSNAYAWLQTGADVLYGAPRESCNQGADPVQSEAIVRAHYEAIIQATPNPEAWDGRQITINPPVKFWNGDIFQDQCFESAGVGGPRLQLIELQVRAPSGEIVETLQVVKGE